MAAPPAKPRRKKADSAQKQPVENPFIIIIDTREQLPYDLPSSQRAALATGDYSIAGFEDMIVVERKQHNEWFMCVGRDRDRFTRELERMATIPAAHIVIETSMDRLAAGCERSQVVPATAIHSMVSWSLAYGVHFWLTSGRTYGERLTLRILQKWWALVGSRIPGTGAAGRDKPEEPAQSTTDIRRRLAAKLRPARGTP